MATNAHTHTHKNPPHVSQYDESCLSRATGRGYSPKIKTNIYFFAWPSTIWIDFDIPIFDCAWLFRWVCGTRATQIKFFTFIQNVKDRQHWWQSDYRINVLWNNSQSKKSGKSVGEHLSISRNVLVVYFDFTNIFVYNIIGLGITKIFHAENNQNSVCNWNMLGVWWLGYVYIEILSTFQSFPSDSVYIPSTTFLLKSNFKCQREWIKPNTQKPTTVPY